MAAIASAFLGPDRTLVKKSALFSVELTNTNLARPWETASLTRETFALKCLFCLVILSDSEFEMAHWLSAKILTRCLR